MKIKFTSGTMKKDGELYTLVLFNNDSIVYQASLDRLTAAEYINKHDKIKMI